MAHYKPHITRVKNKILGSLWVLHISKYNFNHYDSYSAARRLFALWNTRSEEWSINWIIPISWFHNNYVSNRYWPERIYRDWHVRKCLEK